MAFVKSMTAFMTGLVLVAGSGCGSKFSQMVDGRKSAKDSAGGSSVAATTFTTSDGKTVKIGDGSGADAQSDKPRVLLFASMMCGSCKKEAEILVKEYADPNSALHKAELLHLIVGTDEEVNSFKQQNGITWSAAKSTMQQMNQMCGELPPCTLVEHKGRVLLKHEGELKAERDAAHPGGSLEELLEIIQNAAQGGGQSAGAGNAGAEPATGVAVGAGAASGSATGGACHCNCAAGLQQQIDDLKKRVDDLTARVDQNKCKCSCSHDGNAGNSGNSGGNVGDPVPPSDDLTPPPAHGGSGSNSNSGHAGNAGNSGAGGQSPGGSDIPPAFDEPGNGQQPNQPPVQPPVQPPSEPQQPTLPPLDPSRYVTGSYQNFDGQQVDLASLRGEKLVVIFSGPDCGGCRAEAQHLSAELANPNSRLHGAKIVQIFLLGQSESASYAKQKATEWGARWDTGSVNGLGLYQKYCHSGYIPCTVVQTPEQGMIRTYDGQESSATDLIRDLGL